MCAHGGDRVTLYLDGCKSKCIGNNALGDRESCDADNRWCIRPFAILTD